MLFRYETVCIFSVFVVIGIVVYIDSPGVIITDLHKRGGQNDEQYAAVSKKSQNTSERSRASAVYDLT